MGIKGSSKVSLAEMLSANSRPIEKPKGKKRFFQVLGRLLAFPTVLALIVAVLLIPPVFIFSAATLAVEPAVETWREFPEELEDIAIAERSYLYDKNGKIFATLWQENRIVLDSLDDVSDNLINAVVATEDKRFFSHSGFDILGTARAAVTQSGGGSGITQQLVKNLQFFNLYSQEEEKEAAIETSLLRKIKELKLALYYDKEHSKDEILLEYLNTVAVGAPTIYGVETASKYFFNKPAKELSIAESAALVGSINNPGYFTLTNEEENFWKDRQILVINRMLTEGMITEEMAEEAKSEKITFSFTKLPGSCDDSAYPFYCESVLKELQNSPRLGDNPDQREAMLFKGGLHVYTYLDPKGTDEANSFLSENLGDDNRVVAPTAVVQPGTGGIEVMAQNRKWGKGEGKTFINLSEAPAGTGSTFKLVTLAAAIENGIDVENFVITPRCPLYDNRVDLPSGGIRNSGYCPNPAIPLNYKQATAISSNTWYVELALTVGIGNVIEMADRLGLDNTEGITERSGSFPLGSTENTPADMAAAYATFANEGIFCPAKTVSKISYDNDAQVPVPDEYDPAVGACQRVISPYTASTVLKAMKSVVDGSVPDATGNDFAIKGYDTVGKTGTNNLMNTTWVQVSKQYSLFTNVYDMDKPLNGIENIWYKGRWWNWKDHPSSDIGAGILKLLLAGEENKPLNYSSTDRTVITIPVETRDFITVPSVIGMSPEAAMHTLEGMGFVVKIEKKRVFVKEERFPSDSVAVQSLEPGDKVPVGLAKEIILTLSQ